MSEPLWLRKSRESLKKTNIVDLSGENIEDISLFPRSQMLKTLNLSYVQLKTLNGIKKQKNLNVLIADGSHLESFEGFDAFPNLHSVSIQNTKLAKNKEALLSLLLICPKVAKYNNKLIPRTIRECYDEYPQKEIASKLVAKGWMATYPISENEIFEIAEEYEVIENRAKESQDPIVVDDFEQAMNEFEKEHDMMIENAKKECNFVPEDSMQESEPEPEEEKSIDTSQLVDRIATILMNAGIQLDTDNLEHSVLQSVESLLNEYGTPIGQSSDASTEVSPNEINEESDKEPEAKDRVEEEENAEEDDKDAEILNEVQQKAAEEEDAGEGIEIEVL